MNNLELTKGILTKEQLAFRLELHEDEDFLMLVKDGKRLQTFNARAATVAEIRHEGDQIMENSKSGIIIEKEQKK